jgi:hypothetical protein
MLPMNQQKAQKKALQIDLRKFMKQTTFNL